MLQKNGLAGQSVLGWGNRGWVEIIEMVLEACVNGSLKTHIMYKCNLNSKQLAQYLRFLQDHNLIDVVEEPPTTGRPLFVTTELGKKYIQAYKQLESIFSKV